MSEYERALSELNTQQLKAVEAIEGPVLVIAGPGTGKTQLLATRVGRILDQTDALPQNILCLTFTEAGVLAMRERLTKFLGTDAYDVNISTYHAFGSDLLRRYPEYASSYDFEPIDDLTSDSLIREILSAASYSNPLKSADSYAGDIREFINECKRALLKPTDVHNIAKSNHDFIALASEVTIEELKDFRRIDKNSLHLFENLHKQLKTIPAKSTAKITSLKQMCLESLAGAIEQTQQSGKTKPLTAWKNDWLTRDEYGQVVLAGETANQKIASAAEIYSLYQELLKKRRLFDYNDMILRAIQALENHADFKFSLAEQYQYILLDEFQDTNPAQFRLVELLTDNPVNEDRPNVIAVGDDDQAIYAFQGADHANMYRFAKLYRDVNVISLRDNYRSHSDILDIAYNLGGQITKRLHDEFPGVTKILKQSNSTLSKAADIAHHEFISDAAQYAWVAEQIHHLVTEQNTDFDEIVVLAPKHRYLIPLLPYLSAQKLPVRYEKRENILEKPIIIQLENMSRLIMALLEKNQTELDSLWPQVLSYDFWNLPTETIWQISWKTYKQRRDWTSELTANKATKPIAEFFMRVKDLLSITTLEQQLDILTGVSQKDVKEYKLPLRSPLYEYYFGGNSKKDSRYLEALNDLSVMRGGLRANNRYTKRPLGLNDFVKFIDAHRKSDINILNKSPHYEAKNAVNLMTVYQAKGREFKVVFVLAAQDEVWGAASRTASSKISLPPNLAYIRYRGGSDDERLRLLYVAITRAKTHLYLTSYTSSVDGQLSRPLKYLANQPNLSPITAKPTEITLTTTDMQNYWHLRHLPPFTPKLTDLLEPTLASYQLSPTHLNQFIDVERGGPEQFFINSILRFPKGQTPVAVYGSVIHDCLNWIHQQILKTSTLPLKTKIFKYFEERLTSQNLSPQDHELLLERGHNCLEAFMSVASSYSKTSDQSEYNFRSEGVFIGKAHLSGKIDRMLIDKKSKTISVVDFKTGKSSTNWNTSKLHKYRQQLLMYKLMVEGSHSFRGYKVEKGLLVFVEPDTKDQIVALELSIEENEVKNLKLLIQSVWSHITALDFPDISGYSKNLKGIKQFENHLIKNSRV